MWEFLLGWRKKQPSALEFINNKTQLTIITFISSQDAEESEKRKLTSFIFLSKYFTFT